MKKAILVVLVALNISALLCAQEYTFETLTVEDGLSQSSVTCIAQDEKGFLWIGTRDGLNLYDGHNITVFRKTPFDSTSLNSNNITCILSGGSSGLFIGTAKGLQWYDQGHNRFKSIDLTSDKRAVDIRTIYQDQFGILWIATSNGFFKVIHQQENNGFLVTPYFYNDDQAVDVSLKCSTTSFLHDSDLNFWVSTAKGVYRWPYRSEGDLDKVKILNSAFITDLAVSSMTQRTNGEIIAYRINSIYKFSPDSNVFSVLLDQDQNSLVVAAPIIFENRKGELLTTNNTGLNFISLNKESISSTKSVALPPLGRSQNRHKINFVLEDKIYDDFYWLATDLGGVLKMSKRNKKFNTKLLKDFPNLEILNPYLRHILVDGDHVWLNLGSGILFYNQRTRTHQLLKNIFPPGYKASTSSISSLFENKNGSIYAAILGGLIEISIGENQKIITKHIPINLEQPIHSSIILSTQKHIILGETFGRIIVLQKEGFIEVASFDTKGIGNAIARPEFSSFLLDNESNLWVGSFDGLYVFRNFIPGHHRIPDPIYVIHNSEDTTSLVDNRITDLIQDSENRIWVTTRNGLMSATLVQDKVTLKRVQTPELKNKVLYSIIEDKPSGLFWLSSNNGLYRYNPNKNQVDNFDINDGIQGNEFNSYSSYQSASGELFFGGPKGFTSFYPEDIQLDTVSPPIWITDLTTTENQVYNLLIRDSIQPLTLDFSERSFSINFIALDYQSAGNFDYFYTLGGSASLNKIPLGNSQQVNFSQLDPGNYELEIYAVDKNGQRNAKSDTLQFIIKAPFWRMPWFYLLMTGFLGFIGWLLFYLRYRNKVMHLRAIDQVRKNISEDFHDELGSKLSIISMYSEFTKQQLGKDNMKAATYLDKVNDTASRLYENTRDLIWALNPQNDSLYDLFLQLKDFGEEMFQDTEIEFHSAGLAETWKDKNLPMRFKRHLLLIFKEGMHNALKHSGCKTVKLSIDEKDSKLIIMLQDDGIGFDATTEHKGDGLKNMAERAKHLHGGLNFISKKEGTRIWMELSNELLK